MANGEWSFRCCWCFAVFGARTQEEAERGWKAHLPKCRERHLTGSVVRALKREKGERARGYVTDSPEVRRG